MRMGDAERHPESRDRVAKDGVEDALLARLVDLAKRIRGRQAERCEAEGVSDSRFAILRAVAGVSAEGCSQKELAAQLGLSESNVCSLVERMRTAGLLFRFRCRSDRRKSVLLLTERGRELAIAVSRAQKIETEFLISVLDAAQRRELRSLLEQLHGQLDTTSRVSMPSSDVSISNHMDSSHIEAGNAAPGAGRTSRRAS